MKKIDQSGLLLCDLQAGAFELSTEMSMTSSRIFIRRFMNSNVAGQMDDFTILETNLRPRDILNLVDEEYGVSDYGTVKYTKNEMYWIGYIYRYFAYTYALSSKQVYKKLKPNTLREFYLPYHTMGPAQAIERIMETSGCGGGDNSRSLSEQYKIFKEIRQKK